MAKPKPEVSDEAVQAAEKAGTAAVSVFNKLGQFVRTYSAAEHGAEFVKLAEEFAAKKGYSVRKA